MNYQPPFYGMALQVNVKLDLAQMAEWEPDKTSAVMNGIASVLTADKIKQNVLKGVDTNHADAETLIKPT